MLAVHNIYKPSGRAGCLESEAGQGFVDRLEIAGGCCQSLGPGLLGLERLLVESFALHLALLLEGSDNVLCSRITQARHIHDTPIINTISGLPFTLDAKNRVPALGSFLAGRMTKAQQFCILAKLFYDDQNFL